LRAADIVVNEESWSSENNQQNKVVKRRTFEGIAHLGINLTEFVVGEWIDQSHPKPIEHHHP
jgi:hypothetical protein